MSVWPKLAASEQAMKTIYPKSKIWPYIAVASVLFGLAVPPPSAWEQMRVNEISAWPQLIVNALSPTMPATAPNTFDLEARTAPLPEETPAPRFVVPAPTQVSQPSSPSTPSSFVSKVARNERPTGADDPNCFVWCPPPGWEPTLIQPLADTPVRVDPQPPVANRIEIALPKEPSYDDLPMPNTPPSHFEQEAAIVSNEEREIEAASLAVQPINPAAGDPVKPSLPNDARPGDDRQWPEATTLYSLLSEVPPESRLSKWSHMIGRLLTEFSAVPVDSPKRYGLKIAELRRLTNVDVSGLDYSDRQLANRIRLAVVRRLDVWQPLLLMPPQMTEGHNRALREIAQQLALYLASQPDGASWTAYLRLDEMRSPVAAQHPIAIAQQTLSRVQTSNLTAAQKAFLDSAPLSKFRRQLQRSLANNVTPREMVATIEAYESEQDQATADSFARKLNRWKASPDVELYAPAIRAISVHYRNANFRMSVSEQFVNQLIPALHQYAERVSDTILGAEVRGQNSTSTSLSLNFIPDPNRIRMSFQADGSVRSNTSSNVGMVTMFNRGTSTFSSGKELIIDPQSIHLRRTQTQAQSGTRLVGLETALDGIPLLGWITREIARQRHDEKRPVLRAEIRKRVRNSASQRMDRELNERLSNVEQRLQQRILKPLKQLDLDPRALEMRTTADRMVLRSRIASPQQFGAHTPRPQALADSLLSVQVHQTAVNNLIAQLQLGTQPMTLGELTENLSARLGIALAVDLEDHADVVIQFATESPLAFELGQGEVTMTLQLAELSNGRESWKDISVRGTYRADVRRTNVELIRDDGIELIGENLRLRDQVALRSIFTKVLTRNHRLEVLQDVIAKQPRIKQLAVTQLTVRDGWIGVSVGTPRQQTSVADVPRQAR